MKVGIRKPSYKKSFSAKTKGRATRSIKKLTSPGYGKKGIGAIKNPKKALYNYTYNRTTTSLYKKTSSKSFTKSKPSGKSSSYSYKPIKLKAYKPKTRSVKSSSYSGSSYEYDVNIKNTSDYTSIYRYSGNIRQVNDVYCNDDQQNEFDQQGGLYIEDVTSCFEMEYTNIVDETYCPLKLKHSEFELENMQSKEISLDNSKYLNIIKESKANLYKKEIKIKNINDLPFIIKKNKSYSVCGPKFETIKPEGYTEFEGVSYLNDGFFYYDRYNYDANISPLYSNLTYDKEHRVLFELKEENNIFHIYAYYEKDNKLNKGHIGFITNEEINSQLSLCFQKIIQLEDMFLDKPRFKIYVKEDEYKVILQYKKELEEKSEAREGLLESRLANEEIAYQFVTLGVDCENNKNISDAILNYEKAIEIGYSVPFVYERLFLIYKERNEYEKAIKVISKGIEDLRLLCEFCDEKSLDYKIGCFEKSLKEARQNNIGKQNTLKGKNKNSFSFDSLLNNFKSAFNKNMTTKENNNLPKPLKYLYSDFMEKEFYTFQPKGYKTYNKISEYGQDIFIYGSFDYLHFCKNKKAVNNYKLELFNKKIKNGKNISMDFEFEDRDNCIYINSYFYENNNIVKCEIGFINNDEISNELRGFEDIKVYIKKIHSDRIKFSIYVK